MGEDADAEGDTDAQADGDAGGGAERRGGRGRVASSLHRGHRVSSCKGRRRQGEWRLVTGRRLMLNSLPYT